VLLTASLGNKLHQFVQTSLFFVPIVQLLFETYDTKQNSIASSHTAGGAEHCAHGVSNGRIVLAFPSSLKYDYR
jgi:hypothetical protein